jgi:hydrophobic/amphiphilic exporter-1 (mainly G- bacteria), HAE1 family
VWHLTNLAVRNRIITLVAAVLLAGGAIWALLGLQSEMIPNIDFPYITVVTVYPEATPDEVVNDVSVPVEKLVWDKWAKSGLKHVYSISAANMSIIMGEFEYGADMTSISDGINAGLKNISFPAAVTAYAKTAENMGGNPQIIPINMNIMPLISLSLSGNLPAEQLRKIAESRIVPELQGMDGVLKVDAEGGQPDQVIISPDPAMLNRYGISMAQIAAGVASANNSLDSISGTPLGTGDVKIGDVAQVSQGPSPLSSISRTNGQPSVGISITKTEKANTVEVAQAVTEKVRQLQDQLGDSVHIITVFDQSEYITSSINQIWEKAIVGGVLAIAIVFFFLWAIRASLITAISIPLSILIGFLGMRLAGLTINLFTLSAISIAIGRLIDDSIVMVEVIFRRRQRGEGFVEAAIGGAREVANPITTATLATVAIFIPLMFVGGIVGQLFIPFALTVTFAMLASLLVALLVVPALSRFLIGGQTKIREIRDNWYQRIYTASLGWALRHRAAVLITAVALFVASLGLVPVIGTSFMSGMSDKSLTVSIKLPANADISATSTKAAEVEKLLNGNPEIKNYYTSLGTSTSLQGIMSAASGAGDNTATVSIYLKSDADLKKETDTLQAACRGIAGDAAIEVSNSESGSDMGIAVSGVNLSIEGTDADDVARVTNQLLAQLKEVDGLTDISSDLTTVVPKLNIVIDQSKIAASGLPLTQMTQLQQDFYYLMIGGTVPGKTATIDGTNRTIYLKGVTSQLTSVEEASQLKIGYPRTVNLVDVANIDLQEEPTHISHTDTFLSTSITAAITAKNVGAVNQAIQTQIDSLPAHPGVNIKTAGVAEQMGETFSRMGIAIIIAIVIVFLIVILMMRSIRNPLIIMVSLPLAIIGALLGLAAARYTISTSALMGILMLVGIVLTNAIVLVTLVEHLRKSGNSVHDSLIEGGKTRLRPILMTATTTIFAMMPMAVGFGSTGSMLTADLAVVVIGGLFSSTLLTLFVIPVIYSLVHKQRAPASPPEEV